MAKNNFGKTWWGNKWLDAFGNITFHNRLPRGRAYAGQGAVLGVEIDSKGIKAQVQGSRRTPYRVAIRMKSFGRKEKAEILEIVRGDPLFLSGLLTRQMPPELFDALDSRNIRLFPRQWKDMSAECSCPDWAVPCKHIAAVIYMVANEIDKNPFLVFSLHDFDILAELKNDGLDVQKSEQGSILSAVEILQADVLIEVGTKQAERPEALDYSIISNLRNELLSLLPANPLFCPEKDFKAVLDKFYKDMAKYDFANLGEGAEKMASGLSIDFELELLVDDNLNMRLLADGFKSIAGLMAVLDSLAPAEIDDYSERIIALYHIAHFTRRLIEQSAFIPQLVRLPENRYEIRWIPALLNQEVNQAFAQLLEIIPADFIRYQASVPRKKGTVPALISKREQAIILIAEIIQAFALNCYEDCSKNSSQASLIFFTPERLTVEGFRDKELPQTISLWLSRFFIAHQEYVPVLKMEERGAKFKLTVLVDNIKKPLEEPIDLKDIFKLKKYIEIKVEILKSLGLLSEQMSELKKVISSQGASALEFSTAQFADILFKVFPAVKMLGVRILLPKGMEEISRPKLSLGIAKKKTGAITSYLSLQEMLSFEWRIALGDQTLAPEEFFKLVKKSKGIVKLKDQFVFIDEKDIIKILKDTKREAGLRPNELAEVLFAESYQGARINLDGGTKNIISELRAIKTIAQPKGLLAELRPYQERGFCWLSKNAKLNIGSLIADDMGLGKTIQVICALLYLQNEKVIGKKQGLVVVPTALLTNWQNEIKKFAPALKADIYHGKERQLRAKGTGFILTTYGMVKRDIAKFQSQDWDFIAVDEAQNIKNPDTAQTKAIKSLKAGFKIAMSGTPVENRLSEYWSILDFLNPGLLGNLHSFKEKFAKPIELNRDQARLETFKKLTAPFILRRVKTDKSIIKDLPDKIESDQISGLTRDQASLYQNVLDDIMKKIESSADGIEKKGLVFKLMTALKQVCNHPAHYLKEKAADPSESGKTALFLDIVSNINESGEKALIFTQYTEMGKLLKGILEDGLKQEVLFLHGGLSRQKRDEMVDDFQTKKHPRFLILSLKAGGTGLNLTAASNVIHFDLWWNPAVEAQATDRAFRIGQTKNVMVYRLITKGTFEERINQMIRDKKSLADLVVGKGEQWIGEMSAAELKDIFRLA